MCDKACYATQSEARGFLRYHQSSRWAKSKRMYAYRCRVCGFWHLSSMAPKRAKLIGKAIERKKGLR